jgi:hypothetical protein
MGDDPFPRKKYWGKKGPKPLKALRRRDRGLNFK